MTAFLKGIRTKITKQQSVVRAEQQKLDRLLEIEARHMPVKSHWVGGTQCRWRFS